MYHPIAQVMTCVSALIVFSATGCGSSQTATTKPDVHSGEAAHEHASSGPHGGALIELGEEEYHAELVHDDQAGTVIVYVLDSSAKTSVPIDATEVTMNLKHEGRGEQFKLASSADQGDPQGKASRFMSSDKDLAAHLDEEGADAELAITINGNPYRGAVEHHHDHDEAEHAH